MEQNMRRIKVKALDKCIKKKKRKERKGSLVQSKYNQQIQNEGHMNNIMTGPNNIG